MACREIFIGTEQRDVVISAMIGLEWLQRYSTKLKGAIRQCRGNSCLDPIRRPSVCCDGFSAGTRGLHLSLERDIRMGTAAAAATSASRSTSQPLLVRRAAVLGAGTMGSRIAAHLVNAGIPTLLLDLVPAGDGDRNRLAKGALDALSKAKPAAFSRHP